MPVAFLWDSEAATLSQRRGSVETRFVLYESDIRAKKLRLLQGAEEVSVEMSNFREHAYELTLKVVDPDKFDPLTGYALVELWTRVAGSDENYAVYPMGHYRFMDRSGGYTSTERWDMVGRSLEDLLRKDFMEDGYYAPKGTGALAHARNLIAEVGIPYNLIDFPTQDKNLATDFYFDPFIDAAGCWRLSVVNTLLNAGGFYSLFASADSRLRSKKLEGFQQNKPDVFYTSHFGDGVKIPQGVLVGEDMITTGEVGDVYNSDQFANSVTVLSQDSEETTPLKVTVVNDDPESPLSTTNLRRTVAAEPITVQGVTSLAELTLIAEQALANMSGLYRTVTIETLVDPRRLEKEMYVLKVMLPKQSNERVKVPVEGRFQPTGWTITDRKMVHELSRIEFGHLDVSASIRPLSQFASANRLIWGYGERGPALTFTRWGQDEMSFRELVVNTFGELE